MKLSFEQIRSVVTGVMDVTQDAEGGICLHRFTNAQAAIYCPEQDAARYAHHTASVALDFVTDSEFLRFTADGSRDMGDDYVAFDLLINGALTQTFRLTHKGERELYIPVPYGPVSNTFYLPQGEKRVTLYLPWYASTRLLNLELSDGASVRPHRYSRTWLAFGDSITQGAFSEHPALTYVSHTARMLNAQVHNYGISGELFRANKIVSGTYPECDFVTIAYGTNDFQKATREDFDKCMPSFLQQAAREFPDVPVFVILPLWRKAEANERMWSMGRTLPEVRACIAAEAGKYPNFHVVDGSALVPHISDFYADSVCLHPNDAGFAYYSSNLCRIIEDRLK